MRFLRPFGILALAPLLLSAVLDRVAVVVGNHVITETEVRREVRLTEFLNRQPLDLSPAARRAAADRMVDQQLIASELKLSGYPMPAAAEAAPLLAQIERRFPSPALFQGALAQYGLTQAQLRQYLLWQIAVVRFTELRFPAGIPTGPEPSANRAQEPGQSTTVDRQLDDWLKRQRAATHIEFKPEAFQ